jgi:hypothetical protein
VNRSSALGKFAPLAAIAVVQLLVILLVPSVGRTSNSGFNTATGYGAPGAPGAAGTAPGALGAPGVSGGGTTGAAAGAPGAAGTNGGAAPGAGGTTGSVAPGSAPLGTSGQPAAVAGDTKHCVGGRQFDPNLDYYAPPCIQGVPGAPFANNGGATWQGVSKDKIEIVHYIPDYGAEVNTILQAQGLYYTKAQAEVINASYEKFLNEHYQLYGRKIHITTYQGTCQTVPPNLQCLIPEMDRIVDTYHPYAFLWSTTLCSACFAEMHRKGVVTTGGAGFSDAFHNANAPYSYDASMSATRVETAFADWWCHQMTSQGNSGRTAIFAGKQNPAQDFTSKPRVLGVVSTNDPDNENTVRDVLYPALKKGCGEVVSHEYFYAQDINTATQQSQAGTATMNTPNNPATSVVCLCDPVAPQFSYNAAQNNNYWPESLVATNQSMDFDSVAQTYVDKGGQPTLACPKPQQGCSFDNGIGLGSADPQGPAEQLAGYKVYRAGSNNAAVPQGIESPTLDVFWSNYNLLGSLISNTGPILTPARMQQAAPAIGARGGGTTGHALRQFTKGNWCWIQDVRVMYFNKHQQSPYNKASGTYVSIEGRRFNLGQFPTLKQPPAPPPAERK